MRYEFQLIIAPKNIPRYIQCGIYRTGERLLQESTRARAIRRGSGYMRMPWGSCNHSRAIRYRGQWRAIDEYGTDLLDKIPA